MELPRFLLDYADADVTAPAVGAQAAVDRRGQPIPALANERRVPSPPGVRARARRGRRPRGRRNPALVRADGRRDRGRSVVVGSSWIHHRPRPRQLVIGSEGTLAVVTEVTLKVVPRLAHKATMPAPLATLFGSPTPCPPSSRSGSCHSCSNTSRDGDAGDVEPGRPRPRHARRDQGDDPRLPARRAREQRRCPAPADSERAGEIVRAAGALGVYVLPADRWTVREAREKAFRVARSTAPTTSSTTSSYPRLDPGHPRSLGGRDRPPRRRQRHLSVFQTHEGEAVGADDRAPRRRG